MRKEETKSMNKILNWFNLPICQQHSSSTKLFRFPQKLSKLLARSFKHRTFPISRETRS